MNTAAVTVTLLPRNETSLGNIEIWLRLRRGRFLRAEYTLKNVRLFWQQK